LLLTSWRSICRSPLLLFLRAAPPLRLARPCWPAALLQSFSTKLARLTLRPLLVVYRILLLAVTRPCSVFLCLAHAHFSSFNVSVHSVPSDLSPPHVLLLKYSDCLDTPVVHVSPNPTKFPVLYTLTPSSGLLERPVYLCWCSLSWQRPHPLRLGHVDSGSVRTCSSRLLRSSSRLIFVVARSSWCGPPFRLA